MNQGSSNGGWSGRKILLGAGIGCGALLLLFVVMAVAVGYWAYMPGDQVATSTILSDDSVAFLRVQSLGQDPGVTRMLETIIIEARRADARNNREIPAFYRWLMDQQIQRSRKDAGQVREILAREVTVTLEMVSEQTDPRPVIAVNLSRFARLIKFVWWLASDPDRGVEESDEPLKLAFVESTMILAPADLLPRVTARVEGRADWSDPDSEIFQAYQSANPRWDVHGLALNRGRAFEYLSQAFRSGDENPPEAPPPPALLGDKSIRKIGFGVDVVSDDKIEAEITVDSDDPEQARKFLEQALEELRQVVSDPGKELRLESSIERHAEQTVLTLRVANLRQALIRAIRRERDAEKETPEKR